MQIAFFAVNGNSLPVESVTPREIEVENDNRIISHDILGSQDSVLFEVNQQTLQSQSGTECLLATKPRCAPTLNETSEFLSRSVSIEIVIPEFVLGRQHWTQEELKQIMHQFGLLKLKCSPGCGEIIVPAVQTPDECPICQAELDGFLKGMKNLEPEVGVTETGRFISHNRDGSGEAGIRIRLTNPDTKEVISEDRFLSRFNARHEKLPDSDFDPMEFDSKCKPPQQEVGCVRLAASLLQGEAQSGTGLAPPVPGETQPDPFISPPTQSGSASIWLNAVMNAIEGGKYFDANPDNFVKQLREFADDIRERDESDWAVVVFIIDGSDDPDGLFSDGAAAWTQIGGPYIVVTNRLGAYGFDNFDAIFLHEFFHAFYALDEYHGIFDQFEESGYLKVKNDNHEDAFGGGFNAGDPSIMKRIQDFQAGVLFDIQQPPANDREQVCSETDSQGNVIAQRLLHKKQGEAIIRSIFGFTSQPFLCNGPIPARIFDESQNPPLRSIYVWVDCCLLGSPEKYWQLNIPIKEKEHYRWGTYYWNEFGNNAAIAFEFLDKQGNLMPATFRQKPIPKLTTWEFQSVEFDTPQNAGQVVIYPTRCLNMTCKVAADKNYMLTGDWIFRHEIDRPAAEMLGFKDSDGDALLDPIDTFPAIKMDEFVPRITLNPDIDLYSSSTFDCLFEFPFGSGKIYFFMGWFTNQDAAVVDKRGECGKVIDADLLGPDAELTMGLEPCDPNTTDCFDVGGPPPPPQAISVGARASVNNLIEPQAVVPPPPPPPPVVTPTVLIQAIEGMVSVSNIPVLVTPPDLNGDSDGFTPFERSYAVSYLIGTPIPGYSFDIPLINQNPFGSHNNVTINKVTTVQYCVDQVSTCSSWVNASATDRAFDETGEDFWFVPSLSLGPHPILVRTLNTVDNISGTDPFAVVKTVRGIVVNATGPLLTCANLAPSKQVYKAKEMVNFTLFNNCSQETIILENTAPWVIRDIQGNVVFTPQPNDVQTEIDPGMSQSWQWDQMIGINEFVSQGVYSVEMDTLNAGTYATTCVINNDRLQKGMIGGSIIIDPIDLEVVAASLVGAQLTGLQELAADVYPPVEPGDDVGTCGDGVIDLNDILVLIEIIESRISMTDQCGVP